jgi:hypothetical protein
LLRYKDFTFRPDYVETENSFPEPCSLAFLRCKSVSGSSSFPRLCFSHSNKTLGGNDSLLFNCHGSRKRLSPLRNLCDGARKSSNIVFVELIGIEPTTSGLQSPRSPS